MVKIVYNDDIVPTHIAVQMSLTIFVGIVNELLLVAIFISESIKSEYTEEFLNIIIYTIPTFGLMVIVYLFSLLIDSRTTNAKYEVDNELLKP